MFETYLGKIIRKVSNSFGDVEEYIIVETESS